MDLSHARKAMTLFDGLDRAYGTYQTNGDKKVPSGTKKAGKGTTIQQPVTEALWLDHLNGEQRMGIVPIRDDAAVKFAAIDIDDYSMSFADMEEKIHKLKYPVLMTRTKSGGLHLYIFFKEPQIAKDVRALLGQWAISLGYPGAEIFPKQDSLANDHDVGNWINMPYFNAADPDAYGILDGEPLDFDSYVRLAEKRATTLLDIEGEIASYEEPEGLEDGPPCLQHLAIDGVPEGSRNDALFNFAVYARIRYADDWEHWVDDYNSRFMSPPLGSKEVRDTVRSVGKKNYFYTCSRPVLAGICSKSICRSRQYGIGSGGNLGVTIDGLTKIGTEPPMYIVQVSGHRVKMELEDLFSQTRFIRRLMGAVDVMLAPLKPEKYRQVVNELLKNAEHFEAPEDAGVDGMFLYHLQQFCVTKAPARDLNEVLLGKPFHDDDGRTYFRSGDLIRYLEQQKFRGLRQHQIWTALRDIGASHEARNLSGRHIKLWSIDSFPVQSEDFDLPNESTQHF